MAKLSAPVGKGGANREADVFAVQAHLLNWINLGPLKGRVGAPNMSGKCDPATIDAIGAFQKLVVGMSSPDHRIDPSGQTFIRLIGPVTLEPRKSLRTDYTSKSTLRKRAQQAMARGDKYVRSMGVVMAQFHPEFDDFAARVAHGLRRKMVYRSDGGRIARGLVRASGDLEQIHLSLGNQEFQQGDPVALEAYLFRRKDPVAQNRWVMSIRFRPTISTFDEDEGNEIISDPIDLKRQLCTATDKVIGAAALVATDIPGEQGKRIRRMVEIADRLGCQRAAELWYYNREVAFEYFTWGTSDARRKEMTATTAGRMPFDGHVLGRGEWRLFPFKSLVQRYGAHSGIRDSELKSILLDVDFAIFMTLGDIDTELQRNGPLLSELKKWPGGGKSLYGLAHPFLTHLIQLQKSSDHLYSAYK